MAQAKKKAVTKTAAKKCCRSAARKKSTKCAKKNGLRYEKYDRSTKSNMFFVVTMSILAATLLFADLLMLNA